MTEIGPLDHQGLALVVEALGLDLDVLNWRVRQTENPYEVRELLEQEFDISISCDGLEGITRRNLESRIIAAIMEGVALECELMPDGEMRKKVSKDRMAQVSEREETNVVR